MTPRQVALSWSGGKDSALALQALRGDPAIEVVALVTTITRGYDRISIHGVRRSLLRAQADAAGLPLHEIAIDPACTNAQYEAAFGEGVARLRAAHPSVVEMAFGDLFLEDVRAYRERLVATTGLRATYPLWGSDTRVLAERFIRDGFEARLVCVDTTQLAREFTGRCFDAGLLADLPAGVDPCGERGEFHTFVSAGPVLARRVGCRLGEIVLRDARFAYCELEPLPDECAGVPG